MTRKTIQVTIQDEGRDFGKIFQITEMSATSGELWAMRAFMAMAKGGMDIPDNIRDLGIIGLFKMGIEGFAKAPFEVVSPLLDELMQCIRIIPSASNPGVVRSLVEDDIEEIITRLKLKKEAFLLHVDFTKAVDKLTSATSAASGLRG